MEKRLITREQLRVLRRESPANYLDDDMIVGDDISLFPLVEGTHRVDGILLMLCRTGRMGYVVDGHPREALAGDAVIVTERHTTSSVELSDDFTAVYVVMSVAFFYDSMRNVSDLSALYIFSRNNPVVHLSEAEVDVFANWVSLLRQKLAAEDNHYRRELVRSLFIAMLYDMSDVIWRRQEAHAKRRSRADQAFMEFIQLVEANYTRQRAVAWYAERLGLSAKYLAILISKASGRPPGAWIDRYVTLDIRLMLRDTRMSIRDIAEKMNFANQSILGKYFKERVGVSPRAYRAE